MIIEELSSLHELVVQTFNSPAEIALPNDLGNLLDLPTAQFYITHIMEDKTKRNS